MSCMIGVFLAIGCYYKDQKFMKQRPPSLPSPPCNVRHIIESDQLYQDDPPSCVVCQNLNYYNQQQEQIDQEEHSTDSALLEQESEAALSPQSQPKTPLCFDQFFSFTSSIDSDCFPGAEQKGPEDSLALEKQFELASFEDSGGTTKFGWAAIEEDQRRITDRDKLQTGASRGLSKEEKGYSKNIACYISKTVRRMMFGKYKDAVIRLCARKEVRYEDFQTFCEEKKFSGINGLVTYYSNTDNVAESSMKNIFRSLFQKILRRAYLRTVVEEGKMSRLDAYIEYKNRYLLNLAQTPASQ